MISIARKNLFSEKVKLSISVGGVALSILVILAPFAVYFGSLIPSKLLPLNSGANYWLVQDGSGDLFHTSSILRSGYEDELKNVEGVNSASPIINYATRIEIGGEKVTAAVLGFDEETGMAKPWNIHEGTSDIKNGEIVIDRSLAFIHDVGLGDTVRLNNEDFKVTGISLETNVLVFQYLFIRNEDAARVFKQDGIVNYYLLDIDEAKKDAVINVVESIVPDSKIKTKETIANSNAKVIKDSFLSVLVLLAVIGLFVGTAIIGITVYTTTMDRSREYGVLKAIGIKNSRLYSIVFEQAFIISFIGFLAGLILYLIIEKLSFYVLPAVNYYLPWQIFIYVFITAMIMSVFSSFIPIKKINSLDPARVFKS